MEYKLPLIVEIELLVSNHKDATNMKQVMMKETFATITIDIPDNYLGTFECIDTGTKLLHLRAMGSEWFTEKGVQSLKGSMKE